MYQDQAATTTIRKVVNKIRSRGRIPEQEDGEIYQLVIDTMRDLSLFTLPHKQITKITIDSLGRVQLPKDYLMFLGIGVPKFGRFYTFTKDKSVVQTTDQTYAYEAVDTAYGEGESPATVTSYAYGSGGGLSDTTFVINERRGFIQLTDFIGTDATLYYVSSGISDSPDGVTIPLIAEEAVIAGVLWKHVAYDQNVNMGIARERERLYGDAQMDIKRLSFPTTQEILDNYYKDLYQTVKR
ncbi:MAG: hypothetical protein ACYC5G_05035 [Candidatus Doudnabacteria bacterium]